MDNATTTQSGRRKIIALVVALILGAIKMFGGDIDAEVWSGRIVDILDVLIGLAVSVYGWFSFKQAKASADAPATG